MASTSAATTNVIREPTFKGSYSKCCFTGCGLTKRKNPRLHFFRFPVNRPTILEQWLVNCGDENLIDLPNKTLYARKVCEKHFTLDCFTNDMKRFLKKDAVPTVLNIDDSVDNQDQTVSETEGPNHDENVQLSPPESSQLLCRTTSSPNTPTTPEYKKYKSTKNRTPTHRKQALTPMKRRLLSKLKSSEKKKKKYQTRAWRIAMRKKKINKQELVCMSSTLPLPTTGPSAASSASLKETAKEMEDGEIIYEDSDVSDSKAFDSVSTPVENKRSLEACSVRYFAGYVVRACLKKDKCQTCLDDLVQLTTSRAPDEGLIRHREYMTASGDACEALISPADVSVDVANKILDIFYKMHVKNIYVVGIRKRIEVKCRRIIFKDFPNWMKCGTNCYNHRMFFVNKLITVKLHWKLQELSKELRQPGGKYGGYHQKVKILEGK